MKLQRPHITQDDSILSKIIKYIPAEIITVYTAIVGILKQGLNSDLPKEKDVNTYFWVLLIIILVTPIWTYFAVIDNPDVKEPPTKTKRAIFHASIATIAFAIWVYAVGDVLFKSWLCDCHIEEKTSCNYDIYDSKTGSVVLLLFTIIFVPLLERLVLGKPTPAIDAKVDDGQKIIDACENEFEAYKSDCSGFVKAVATSFSIILTGQADSIVDQTKNSIWMQLGSDGVKAKEMADKGWLVIAGLKSSDNVPPQNNGHVAVVVAGVLGQGKYPSAYWGRLGGIGMKNKTINYSWNKESRDKVIYAAREV